MASGKKNYFRHSMSAFEDEKIQKAIELLGYEGYAFYFILIELLARQCENGFKTPISLHQQTLRIVWRKSQQSCHKVVRKLEESGLFLVTIKESLYEFHIPNLAKYLGSYDSKSSAKPPNKRKENKIKLNDPLTPYEPSGKLQRLNLLTFLGDGTHLNKSDELSNDEINSGLRACIDQLGSVQA